MRKFVYQVEVSVGIENLTGEHKGQRYDSCRCTKVIASSVHEAVNEATKLIECSYDKGLFYIKTMSVTNCVRDIEVFSVI